MIHKIPYEFEVEVERDEDAHERRRYIAWCRQMRGCYVHARTEEEALEKIKDAIALRIDFASRLFM